MNELQHKIQSQGTWQGKPYLEQMANIGSEVYRAINWKKKNNQENGFCKIIRAF